MLVVSLAAITKQRTALVQTDARPNATQPAYCLVPDFFRIAMLNCCSASSNQTISTPRYSDHPSVGNLDAAEIEARNDLLNRLLFLEQLSHSFSAFVRQGSLPPPHFAQNCQLLVPTKLLSSIFDTYFLCGTCQLFSGQDNALVAAVGWQKIKGA